MSSALLNLSVATEAHIQQRLGAEPILWLGTVSPSGQPHTAPVWFSWNDPTILLFSQPKTVKLAHLRANQAVSISLDSATGGTDIVTGEGTIEFPEAAVVRVLLPGFARKYEPMLGGNPIEGWLRTFSQPVLITVHRLIGWTRTANGLDYRSLPARQR